MKMTTIRIMSVDKDKIIGYEIGDDIKESEKKIIDIPMNKNIYLRLLAEMKKADIPVDGELKCMIGHIFTMTNVDTVYLRKDLENLYELKT
jgi:hypothetical protein